MSATQYPTIAAGARATAALVSGIEGLFASKASDQSVTSNTTLQDDADLQFSVVANAVYEVTGILFYTCDSTTGKLKLGFIAPAGATFSWVALGTNGTVNPATSLIMDRQTISSTSYILDSPGTGTVMTAHIRGLLRIGGTAGTFKAQFAQNGSIATATTMKADTHMRVQRVA